MTRRLHEVQTDANTAIANHLDAFDELVTLGESVDEARHLGVLLSSLIDEYELISSIIEIVKDITLIKKEYESCTSVQGQHWTTQENVRKGSGQKKNSSGSEASISCATQIYQKRTLDGDDDAVFAVSTERVNGCLIDSRAIAHMTPHRSDQFEYKIMNCDIEVTISDGKKLQVTGRGFCTLNSTGR
ncbi:hypothetical protein DD238_006167 [Peronospora effusa]|uniref:Uncharacterized protein n=1 Tax=Peronospora effusa TaxID=542832 RepID=A0A3M6VWC3_9STRA|nr:hypothetical protein DD238_006167 [Peronospora effusa]RQM09522.1 hypothetical protein DD237_007635 [Peronospora effusa]